MVILCLWKKRRSAIDRANSILRKLQICEVLRHLVMSENIVMYLLPYGN